MILSLDLAPKDLKFQKMESQYILWQWNCLLTILFSRNLYELENV